MTRPATDRLKVNPQLGRMPTLQFCRPSELRIDPAYQRSTEGGASQTLIRKIAQHWNWDLCQPLIVARREGIAGDRLFVIDGQHRLEAARQRGDIDQLPCVIVTYNDVADEAASFVHLNQQRRPLSPIDIFKAAVASGDSEANQIVAAMTNAGISIAPHSNPTCWKPGAVSNISGIQRSWRIYGAKVTATALRALAGAFEDQVLQYAGTIFPGIAAVFSDELAGKKPLDEQRFERFRAMLAARPQVDWRNEIGRTKGEHPGERFDTCSAITLRSAWAKASGDARPVVAKDKFTSPDGHAWCDQCDMRVSATQAAGCRSRFCSVKVAA